MARAVLSLDNASLWAAVLRRPQALPLRCTGTPAQPSTPSLSGVTALRSAQASTPLFAACALLERSTIWLDGKPRCVHDGGVW